MAQARKFARVQTLLALFGIVSAFVIYGLVTGWNPLPSVANWFQNLTVRHLSSPRPEWTARVGDEPDWATVLPSAVIVGAEGDVDALNPVDGKLMWQRPAAWAAVAGAGSQAVVLISQQAGAGFGIYDATSGELLKSVGGKAGVWAYADMVLILTCSKSCTLTAYEPNPWTKLWSAAVPGSGATLMGYGQALAEPVPVSAAYAGPLRADPQAAPPYLGLPMGGQIDVVATDGSGKVHVFPQDRFTRTVVAGSVVVAATATANGGDCYFTVAEYSPTTGAALHRQTGLDLGTAPDCDTRHDPAGSGQFLVGRDANGRAVIFDAGTGKTTYRAESGAEIVAMDAGAAIVRSAAGGTLLAIRPSDGDEVWHASGDDADLVGITPDFVLSAYPVGDGSITIYNRSSGASLLTVTSTATVLGIGPHTVMISIGRTVGPLAVPSGTPPPARPRNPF